MCPTYPRPPPTLASYLPQWYRRHRSRGAAVPGGRHPAGQPFAASFAARAPGQCLPASPPGWMRRPGQKKGAVTCTDPDCAQSPVPSPAGPCPGTLRACGLTLSPDPQLSPSLFGYRVVPGWQLELPLGSRISQRHSLVQERRME